MKRPAARALWALSAAGYPICQYTLRRFGRTGSAVVESACLSLLARDATLLAHGTTKILRTGPATLLWCECAAAAVAAAATAYPLVEGGHPAVPSRSQRVALAALFLLHTVRFGIYLRPDQGRRVETAGRVDQ